MRKFWLIILSISLFFPLTAQKYVFDNKAVYQGVGLFQNKPQSGKFVLYWSSDKQIIGLEIFDREGTFVSMTIFDPQKNRLIGLDEREKTGFIVPYNQYATNPVNKDLLDSTHYKGTSQINNKPCSKYQYTFSNGQTTTLCISQDQFNSALLKILKKTGYNFMRLPYGFKGVISSYTLNNSKGVQIAHLELTELTQGKLHAFDMGKYKLQRF